jgi:DNA-binding SARP family transcriptional activator/tetratricopeptide (TPR) repeat protein
MYFRVLGPVEVWNKDRRHPAGTLKEQLILSVLLIAAGRIVSVQDLAERIWDDQPPDRARETIQVYVSRLRKNLRAAGDPTGLISSSPAGGYRIDVSPDQVDVHRFEQLLNSARAAAAEPNLERARGLVCEAENLWNGSPLESLSGEWAQATRQALNERLRAAVLMRIELDMRLGDRGDAVISELTAMTGTGSIDQKAVGLLMVALNNVGRQDDALATYRRAGARLRTELGVGPRAQLEAIHQRILRGEPAVTPSNGQYESAGPAPDTLDRDPQHLIGRDEELRELLATVAESLETGKHAVIYALDGMAGIGKTALAVRAAHRLRVHCSGGSLQVDLRSYHPHQPPLEPREALIQLLEAVSTPSAQLGAAGSVDALAALWRRRSSGRQLLLLLDDVLDAEQIRPLLPTAPGSIVLVTSRRRLSGLVDAQQRTVPLLGDASTSALLTRITGRDFTAQRENMTRFSSHCGGLPLAVAVAAAHLRTRPAWNLGDLVERLTTATAAVGDDNLTAPVRAALAMSYRALSATHRILLRRLAAHPGQDVGLHAAAVMAAMPRGEADLALDVLIEHHLVMETARHRYRLHDLVRAFALLQVKHEGDTVPTDDSVHCVLEFYLATAARAENILRPYRRVLDTAAVSPTTETVALDTREVAQAWLDSESANLTAGAAYAHKRGLHRHASLLPYFLAQHLDRHGHWQQAVDILRTALDAEAVKRGDAPGSPVTAQLMTDLAAAHIRTSDPDEASTCAAGALEIWRSCGDERGQADALIELGRAHWYARRPADAANAYEGAVDLCRRIGDQRGHVVAGYHLGIVQFELGHHDAAFAQARQSLKSARLQRDSTLQCDVMAALGEMYRLTGQDEQALDYFGQARVLADRQGDPHTIAVLASNMGAIQDRIGDHDAALASFDTALRIFRSLGDRRNEIDAMVYLARALTRVHAYEAAFARLTQAVLLAEHIQDPLRHAQIHLETGRLHQAQSCFSKAADSYRSSLIYAQEAASPLDQAHAHRALGDALSSLKDHSAAEEHWNEARDIYRRLGHRDAGFVPEHAD